MAQSALEVIHTIVPGAIIRPNNLQSVSDWAGYVNEDQKQTLVTWLVEQGYSFENPVYSANTVDHSVDVEFWELDGKEFVTIKQRPLEN